MSSKYARKRKHDLDVDTTEDGGGARRDRPRSRSPSKRSRRREKDSPDGDSSRNEESISIEETNKIRAKLGLAPLEIDQPPQEREDDESGEPGEKVFTEDGMEIVHKAAKSLTSAKQEDKLKEKLDVQRQKREVYTKVLGAAKGLADSDSDDDAQAWTQKSRKLEEERKKAAERTKALDEMDETFGNGGSSDGKAKQKSIKGKPKEAAPDLIVGHSTEAFLDGKLTVLVLADKNVLDENGEEVLINPNMLDDERHKKNVELRKKKGNYRPFDEDVDEFGMTKKQSILAKYDEEGDDSGAKRETFRLDASGTYDVDKEAHELNMKRKLMMANKKFETLEQPKYQIAREFYTEEEMIAFRKPKKKKDGNKIRKRKVLKADDIVPQEEGETEEERKARAAKLAARRREGGSDATAPPSSNGAVKDEPMETAVNGQTKLEEGELDEDAAPQVRETTKWKKGTGPAINVDRIKQLMNKVGKKESDSDESSDDGDLVGGVNLAGIVVDDDDADELAGMLERTRRLKQQQAAQKSSSGAEKVREMLTMNGTLRDEDAMENEDDDLGEKRGIVIDATSEYYKSIGDIPTYGLAGNRDDDVDYSELLEERAKLASQKVIKEEQPQSDESDHEIEEKPTKKKHKRRESERSKEGSPPASTSRDRHGEKNSSRRRQQSESDEEVFGDDYKNVLGEEKDVTKGVAAMLKLAGEKGYLEPANSRRNGDSGLKQSLESKRFSRVEQGRFDIEDKYIKKLERMGTTGTGPVRPFPEKRDYVPNVEISYTDQKGRILEQKEAFRELSWKFHGKGPGKKQIEKRQAQQDKKERLKKMNSSDTPLGTLQKQLKKQEQVQTPYLILSGAGRDNGTQLQKE